MTTTSANSPHVAVIPSSGMGHLLPYLRLAAMLAARGCSVTVISAQPTVSDAESDQLLTFFAIHPHIKRIDFHILPHQKSQYINQDPFFIQFEAIANSVHLLHPILSSLSPPLSAIVADFVILSGVSRIAEDLRVPLYTLILPVARFFCLMAELPRLKAPDDANSGCVELPVIGKIPVSSVPPIMFNPSHFFAACIHINAPSLSKVKGILLNTLTLFEPEAMEALNANSELAPILPVGPLQPYPGEDFNLPWLNEQAPGSVFYISFGNKTALSKDQIQELALGLEKSGCKFLWVLKGSKVDKEDNQEVEEMLGEAFLARTRMQGVVIKGWVDQDRILAHPSVGGFLSHCGWNSVMEAARVGVPILAWPQAGDQRISAEVAEKIGLGLWDREWGWMGKKLVNRDQIADRIMEVMKDKHLRARVNEIKEKASKVWDVDGASEMIIQGMIDSFKTGKKES